MISTIGRFVLVLISRFGYAARTLISLIGASGDVLRRPRLVLEQLRFIGNDSFIIIAVSGLFVGFVLGLQGYNTL
ncbi:UNVERIFIED_CONTAM: ABC transporter permease, partial [Mumia flava]